MRVLAFELTASDMEEMYVVSQFMRKVRFAECWVWQAGKDKDGYGKWQVVGSRRKVMAHRFAYEWFIGPIPDGLHLDHLCKNRACVNPQHLEPVTPRENSVRGQRGRKRCRFGHLLQAGEWKCAACART